MATRTHTSSGEFLEFAHHSPEREALVNARIKNPKAEQPKKPQDNSAEQSQ